MKGHLVITHLFQAFTAACVNLLIQIVPFPVAVMIARSVGDMAYFILRKRRVIAISNIKKALGDSALIEQRKWLVQSSFRNIALSIVDLFLIEKVRRRANKVFEIEGLEFYKKALALGRGVVLVTSHLGSWEYLAFLFYLTETRCSVVVKSLKNPHIDYRVNLARKKTNLNPIAKKDSIRSVLKELKNRNTVAILIDQWAGHEGVWQKFFGEETSTTSLPARLAKRTGAALLPAFCLRQPGGKYKIIIHPPLVANFSEEKSEEVITKRLNETLEGMILRYPDQWIWTHRRWKSKPDSTRHQEHAG